MSIAYTPDEHQLFCRNLTRSKSGLQQPWEELKTLSIYCLYPTHFVGQNYLASEGEHWVFVAFSLAKLVLQGCMVRYLNTTAIFRGC